MERDIPNGGLCKVTDMRLILVHLHVFGGAEAVLCNFFPMNGAGVRGLVSERLKFSPSIKSQGEGNI